MASRRGLEDWPARAEQWTASSGLESGELAAEQAQPGEPSRTAVPEPPAPRPALALPPAPAGRSWRTELARIGQNARSHPSPAAEGPSAATRELLYVLRAAPGHDDRCYNTSIVFGPSGERLATYRKLHLFDVDVPGGVRFRESDTTLPGEDVVVAQTELGPLGLSVCYDMRFPELYRAHTDRGATMLAVPSAFTLMTGKDHWHTLLRARAIECQSYVFAPAQWGEHDDAGLRRSYGHALIVDPSRVAGGG